MPSSRDRQRKLARAKIDRQMARRAALQRRKRRIQAGVGATLALVLIVLGGIWLFGGFDPDPEVAPVADTCTWAPQNAGNNANLKDVGNPPAKDLPTSGSRDMTVTTNQGGPITVKLDLATAPCAGASFAHLAGRQFFNNTKCHELTTEGALRCGDPSGTGLGGPTYTFADDADAMPRPPAPQPSASAAPEPLAYPKGSVAMVGAPPGSNGSQFLLFFKDFRTADPTYPIVGTVTGGLDVLDKIGKSPTVDNGSGAKTKPAKDILVQTLTVAEPAGGAGTPAPSPAPSASGQS